MRLADDALIIDLLPSRAVRQADFDAVLDLSDFGDVVGIEILDFRRQLGGGVPAGNDKECLPNWSYDEQIDAFYLRLARARATIQRSVVRTATVDAANGVASLTIPRWTCRS